MEVSKLTLMPETMSKAQGNEQRVAVGRLRWEKLRELTDSGKLGEAKNRQDVVEMLGYNRNNVTVYNWLVSHIRRGNIVESLYGVDSSGPAFEYYIAKNPKFDAVERGRMRKQTNKKHTNKKHKRTKPLSDTSIKYIRGLIELDDSGELGNMASRKQLGISLGVLSRGQGKFSAWVGWAMSVGLLSEDLKGDAPFYILNRKVAEERLALQPKLWRKDTKETIVPPRVEEQSEEKSVEPQQATTDIVITRGDMTIKISGANPTDINSFLGKLMGV